MKYLLESILSKALQENATDIHITIKTKTEIELRKKGKLVKIRDLENSEGESLINYIKFLSGLELDRKLSLNTGSFTCSIDRFSYRFRVSSIPTIYGNHLVIRLLDHITLKSLEQLTYDQKAISILRQIEGLRNGLILFSGPTGVGKSTTLHVLLKEIYEHHMVNVITIEDPIEMIVPEFTQIQISKSISYDTALKQILRHDPDVIMIGELRDVYATKLAIRCALTGSLVLATIHSKDSISTLNRLKNLEVEQDELMEVLKYIVSQRLIYVEDGTTAVFDLYNVLTKERYLSQEMINE